ncbi:MAG: photosystem II stability/assembly factor-like uncharacterized protein [Arcticibacterium sp.]|jgi:photosystem II stability/assembly factor-like uncharacterized protein
MTFKNIFFLFFFLLSFTADGQWQILQTGTEASFRSLEVLSKTTVWAGGSDNTILYTKKGGKLWQSFKVGLPSKLDFRAIKAINAKTVVIVSAGLAEEGAAKIFRTENAGKNWIMTFETKEKGVFLDGIAFFDELHGLVIGDPIKNQPYILETKDGGISWQRMSPEVLPQMIAGEASFAASNSGIVTHGDDVWYALQSRIFHSFDRGQNWEVLDSGLPSGPTNGIFGIRFLSKNEGFIVGGDYIDESYKQINLALTPDGGKSWEMKEVPHQGLKECLVYTEGKLLVVGTSGTSFSTDSGQSWQALDKESFHVVSCSGKTCFAIGGKGHMGKMNSADLK